MTRLPFVLLLGLPLLGAAQAVPSRNATVLDVTGAVGPSLNYFSVAGWRLWGIDAGGRLQVGLGIRSSYFYADNLPLNRQSEGSAPPQLVVAAPRLGAVNAAFHLRARVAGPVRVGFNLDFAGVSFGPERTSSYVDAGSSAPTVAQPRPGNLLHGGTNDRGSLNSELYASVALTGGLGLRAGYSHSVTGYEAADVRYRLFRNLALLGLSYQLP